MKKTFEIPVTRIGYSYKTITVEANSQEEAEEIALDTAGDEEFSERESDYVLPESAGDETITVKVLLGEDACKNFSHIEFAKTKDDIITAFANEYGEDEVKSCVSEIAMGIQTFTFKTQAEANAFAHGISTAQGYLEGGVLTSSAYDIADIIEKLDEQINE